MAQLAEELCGCKAELLTGGLNGANAATMVAHLWKGQPVLVPYPPPLEKDRVSSWKFTGGEFLNSVHQLRWGLQPWAVPAQRPQGALGCRLRWDWMTEGPKCMLVPWTCILPLGALLGLEQGSVSKEHIRQDPTLPWLFLSTDSCPCPVDSAAVEHTYVLAKQGKSLHYQLWSLEGVSRSNQQLRDMDPKRESDGTRYVLPPGGVEAGLAGQAVLLHTRTQWLWTRRKNCSWRKNSSIEGWLVPWCRAELTGFRTLEDIFKKGLSMLLTWSVQTE